MGVTEESSSASSGFSVEAWEQSSSEISSFRSKSSSEETASSAQSSPAPVLAIEAELLADAVAGQPSNVSPAFFVKSHHSIEDADDLLERIRVAMIDSDDREIPVDVRVSEKRGGYRVSVDPPSIIAPGQYAMHAELDPSRDDVRRGADAEAVTLLDETISWGMIAFNVDKSHYAQGDSATLTIAPLVHTTVPACVDDAFVRVGASSNELTPSCDGAIRVGLSLDETDRSFALDVSAGNVSWSVSDALPTNGDPSVLDVRRIGATTVVLGRIETMDISVTAARGFRGAVTEAVPPGFDVSDVRPSATVDDRGDAGTFITWNGSWEAGETRHLTYSYKAPAEAPLLALFGPLEADGVMTADVEVSLEAGQESSSSSSSFQSSSVESASSASSSSDPAVTIDEEVTASSEESTPVLDVEVIVEPQAPDAATDAVTNEEGGSFLGSVLSHLYASLFEDGETVSFDEERRMQVLVVTSSATIELASSSLELTPLQENFEAKSAATFRLFANVDPEGVYDDGTLPEHSALSTIVEQLSDAEDLRDAVLSSIVEDQGATIAESMAQDSESVYELQQAIGSDGSVIRRIVSGVESGVERVLKSDDVLRDDLATIAAEDPTVQTLVDAIITDDLRKDVADEIAAGGDIADIVSDIVEEHAESLPDAVASAVVQAPDAVDAVADAISDGAQAEAVSSDPIIAVTLTDRDGVTTVPSYHFAKGSLLLVLDPIPAFVPGIYTLSVTITNPLTGESQTLTQDFAWGVLAINPDSDVYEPGDVAELHFGVLDDLGEMVCDAELTLVVTAPDGSTNTLTTNDDSIEVTGTCQIKEAGFIGPDFRTAITLLQEGDYVLSLTAVTEMGQRSMQTTVPVRTFSPFAISRAAATRLYPTAPSGMDVTVEFNVDIEGSVIDTLPPGFVVTDVEPAATVSEAEDGTVTVRWRGDWNAGQIETFRYEYDAPDISPQFYLIGPLQIRSEFPISSAQ